jgi:glutaconate CoA-transferase subunit B
MSNGGVTEYSNEEVQVCRMAREFKGEVIATGATLLSALATSLAKALYDDDLVLIGDSWGSFDCDPGPLVPHSEWLRRTSARGSVDWSLCFDYISADMLRIFVGPPQIDRSGNANISVVGDWYKPTIQLIGSRGLPDDVWRCSTIHYHIPRHTPLSVVETVDFVSSFGYGERRDQYPQAKGRPGLLVTDLGVFTWPDEGGDMQVESLHPGVTPGRVQAQTGFELKIPSDVSITEPPTTDELRVLRDRLDPFEFRHGGPSATVGDRVGQLIAASLIPRPHVSCGGQA